mmetsp:Transcript_23940/g.59666  ORF Transcript_23940/g.59666 Transcript_23940/m.59666 type:complete len:260 (+) Transcript_23940:66-845(+)
MSAAGFFSCELRARLPFLPAFLAVEPVLAVPTVDILLQGLARATLAPHRSLAHADLQGHLLGEARVEGLEKALVMRPIATCKCAANVLRHRDDKLLLGLLRWLLLASEHLRLNLGKLDELRLELFEAGLEELLPHFSGLAPPRLSRGVLPKEVCNDKRRPAGLRRADAPEVHSPRRAIALPVLPLALAARIAICFRVPLEDRGGDARRVRCLAVGLVQNHMRVGLQQVLELLHDGHGRLTIQLVSLQLKFVPPEPIRLL